MDNHSSHVKQYIAYETTTDTCLNEVNHRPNIEESRSESLSMVERPIFHTMDHLRSRVSILNAKTAIFCDYDQPGKIIIEGSKRGYHRRSTIEKFSIAKLIGSEIRRYTIYQGVKLLEGKGGQFMIVDYESKVENGELELNMVASLKDSLALRENYGAYCVPVGALYLSNGLGPIQRGHYIPTSSSVEELVTERTGEPQIELNIQIPGSCSPQIAGVVHSFEETASKMSCAAVSFETLVSTINEKILGACEMFSSTCPFMLDVGIFVIDVIREFQPDHYGYFRSTSLGCLLIATKFLRTFGLGTVSLQYVQELMSSMYSFIKDLLPQNLQTPKNSREGERVGESQMGFENSFIRLAGLILTRSMKKTDELFHSVCLRLRDFSLLVQGCKSISELVTLLFPRLPELFRAWLGTVCPGAVFDTVYVELTVPDLLKQVLLFKQDSFKQRMLHDSALYRALGVLVVQVGEAVEKLRPFATQAPGLFQQVVRAQQVLQQIDASYRSFVGCTGKRHEPFVITLEGTTNIGKSRLATQLIEVLVPTAPIMDLSLEIFDILKGICPDNECPIVPASMTVNGLTAVDAAAKTYTRCTANKHWDRYSGQFALLYDEFGMTQDGEEYNELMSIKSCASFTPPMASVDNSSVGVKGTFFTSELVVMCTNHHWFRPTTVTDHAALNRRRDLVARVKLKPIYSNAAGQLAAETPREVLEVFGHLLVDVLCPTTEETLIIKADLNVIDFVRFVRTQYRQHREKVMNVDRSDFFLKFHNLIAEEAFVDAFERIGESQMGNEDEPIPLYVVNDGASFQPCSNDETDRQALLDDNGTNSEIRTIFSHNWGSMREVKSDGTSITQFRSYFTGQKWVTLKAAHDFTTGLYSRLSSTLVYIKSSVAKFYNEHTWISSLMTAVGIMAGFGLLLFPLLGWVGKKIRGEPIDGGYFNEETGCFEDDDPGLGTMECFVPYNENASRPGASQMANPSAGEVNRRKLLRNQLPREIRLGESQGSTETLIDLLLREVTKRQVILEINYVTPEGVPTCGRMNGFLIQGTVMVTPRHFFYPRGTLLEEGTPFRVSQRGVIKNVAFSRICYYEAANQDKFGRSRDLSAYKLPQTVDPVRKSRHMLVEGKTAMNLYNERCKLARATTEGVQVFSIESVNPVTTTTTYQSRDGKGEGCVTFVHVRGFEYGEVKTAPGDCGAILMSTGTKPSILGFHTVFVRKQSVGASELFSVEDFDEIINALPVDDIRQGDPQVEILDQRSNFTPRGNILDLGSVKQKDAVRLPSQTQIRPSLIFDLVAPHVKEPAPLQPNDPRLRISGFPILRNALEKYAEETGPVYIPFVHEAGRLVLQQLEPLPQYRSLGILSLDQAINGIPLDPYLTRINMMTSPGYKWRASDFGKTGTGRYHLFEGYPEGPLVPCIELEKAANDIYEGLLNGVRPFVIWNASLKDERLSHEKVVEGSTRNFMVGQLPYLLDCYRFFGAFTANMLASRRNTFSSLGMDPESIEWNQMLDYLTECGQKLLMADYKKFDGTALSEFIQEACDVINAWYNDSQENQRARRILFLDLMNARVLAHNGLFQLDHGVPSGHYLTAVVDTMVGFMYQVYVWLHVAPLPMRTVSSFAVNVHSKICGDDFVDGVSEIASEFFTGEALVSVLGELGLCLTRADKKPGPVEFCLIDELTFLKRNFVVPAWNKSLVVARIDPNSLIDMISWVRLADSPKEALRANLVSCYSLLPYQDENWARIFLSRIRQALVLVGLKDFFVPSFEELVEIARIKHGATGPTTTIFGKAAISCVVDPISLRLEREGESQMDNVVLTDAAAPILEPKGAIASKPFVNSVGESSWTLKQLVERDYSLGTYNWVSGNTNLSLSFPDILVSPATAAAASPFDMAFRASTMSRGDYVVNIQVSGSKFHTGLLLVALVPYHPDGINSFGNIIQYTNQQVGYIDASRADTLEVRIPYRLNCPYQYNFPIRTVATILVKELVALTFATGASPSLPISVTARMSNSEFLIPSIGVTSFFAFAGERDGEPQMETDSTKGTAPCEGRRETDMPDQIFSLRDLGKRFMPLFQRFILPTAEASNNDILSDYGGFYFSADAVINPLYSCGVGALCSTAYTMYRGSLRYMFSNESDNTPYWIFYLETGDVSFSPGLSVINFVSPQSATGGKIWLSCVRSLRPEQLSYSIGAAKITKALSPAMPLGYSDGSGSIVVEVPFLSTCSARYTSGVTSNSRLSKSGVIVVLAYAPQKSAHLIQVSGAFGDSMRFGVFSSIPRMIVSGYAASVSAPVFAGYIGTGTGITYMSKEEAEPMIEGKLADGQDEESPQKALSVSYTSMTTVSTGITSTPTPAVLSTTDSTVGNPTQGVITRKKKPTTIDPRTFTGVHSNLAGTERQGESQMGNTITVYNRFRKVIGSTIPTNVTGDQFDVKAEGALMDKPSMSDAMAHVIVRQMPLANSSGIVPVHHLTLNAGEQVESDFHLFSTTEDEMSIAFLSQKEGLIRKVAWPSTQTISSLLVSDFVAPLSNLMTILFNQEVVLCPLDFAARFGTYWSGDIRYRIHVVASQFQSGKLWIGLNYGFSPTTLSQAKSQYGFLLDLADEKRQFELIAPFKSPYAHLFVPDGRSMTFQQAFAVMSIWVISPLVSPPGVSPSATILVFKNATENFKLGYPSERNMGLALYVS